MTMRNTTGAPAEGEDFFERPAELARLWREMEHGNNLRLNAPRRVGKTSLVLRHCEAWKQRGLTAVYLNVEDTTDELSFVEKLLEGLRSASLQPDALTRGRLLVQNARKALGISGFKPGWGINVELSGEGESTTLARAVESVFQAIDQEGKQVLIAIDEMPEVLLALSKAEDGRNRVAQVLHWLRALRQTYRRQIRWIFLGSIGLEGFVEEQLLGKTINDLTPFRLDAFTAAEADAFLARLSEDNKLPIAREIRADIIARVGWPLPHHLQIFFHALVELESPAIDAEKVEAAFANLLGPHHHSEFDTWRQRLDEQFSKEEAAASKTILTHLCKHASGRSRAQILNALMGRKKTDDPDAVEEQLARLLQLLQRDGYLIMDRERYAFRSFLLREYWVRHYVK